VEAEAKDSSKNAADTEQHRLDAAKKQNVAKPAPAKPKKGAK
jgi:hypothetical protein